MKSFDCLDPNTPLLGHHVLEASAGTGKTFAIEHIVTRMLIEETPPLPFSLEKILIVTFTRAATRDLRKRICKTFHSVLQMLRGEMAPSYPYVQTILERGREKRAQFLLERGYALFDRAAIFTIHGFCSQMLSEFAFEAGLDFFSGIQDDRAYKRVLEEQIDDFFRSSLHPKEYSKGQLYTLMQAFPPSAMKKKIFALIEREGELPFYSDFFTSYSSFQTALKTCPPTPTLIEDFNQVAPAFSTLCNQKNIPHASFQQQVALLASCLEKKECSPESFDSFLKEKETFFDRLNEKNFKKRRSESLSSKTALFFELKEKLYPIIKQAKSPLHTLIRIAREMKKSTNQVLELRGARPPDTILQKMVESLDHPPFFRILAKKFQGAVIDEFQDTDPLQWDIFHRLFLKSDAPLPAFYVVGDPKQSIYSFRNADLFTYEKAVNMIGNKRVLDTNYRSDPTLVKVLNLLLSKTHSAPIVHAPEGRKDFSFHDKKSPVHFFILDKKQERERNWPSHEIEESFFYPFIAKEILSLVEHDHLTYQDFAILVRDRYQAMRLKDFLQSCQIPIQATHSDLISSSPIYSLFRDLLEAIRDPTDNCAAMRALSHPIFGLSHHDLKKEDPFVCKSIAIFHTLSHLFHTEGLYCMLDALLHTPWKKDKSLTSLLVAGENSEAYSDWMKLTELLLEKAGERPRSLSDLTQVLEEIPFCDEEDFTCKRHLLVNEHAVSILTMHKAKGLEFEIVFALGVINRSRFTQDFIHHQRKWFPFYASEERCQAALQEQDAEKLRQFYVAVTRAKKRVYIPALIDPKLVSDCKNSDTDLYPDFSAGQSAGQARARSHAEKNGPKMCANFCNQTLTPLPQGMASPMELVCSLLPALKQFLPAIGASYTMLAEQSTAIPPFSKPVLCTQSFCKNLAHLSQSDIALALDNFHSSCLRAPRFVRQKNLDANFHKNFVHKVLAAPTLVPPQPLSLHFTPRYLHSFSSLARAHHLPTQAENTPDLLPKGPETGTLLHALFEKIMKEGLTSPYQASAISQTVQKMVRTTFLGPWEPQILTIIEKAFCVSLPSGFALKDVASHHLHPEVEFFYSKSPYESVKGFIDLVFFHQDHYYLLDWKSNVLTNYSAMSMQEAMRQNDYYLQADLYTEALRRYLARTKASRPIGGIFYVFLRGLEDEKGILFLPTNK